MKKDNMVSMRIPTQWLNVLDKLAHKKRISRSEMLLICIKYYYKSCVKKSNNNNKGDNNEN